MKPVGWLGVMMPCNFLQKSSDEIVIPILESIAINRSTKNPTFQGFEV